jgi:hypothetical protein
MALDRMIMGIAAIILSVAMATAGSDGRAGDMPSTPTGFYQAGETFAQCSAHFAFAAEAARDVGLTDTATALEDLERGWALAGGVLLWLGLTESRRPGVEQLFADLEGAKVAQFRSWRELEPQGYSQRMTSLFQSECAPWVDLQEAIIAGLRGAASAQ